MKKVLVMVMCALMCCLMLTGCGDSKYAGTYDSGKGMSIELKKDHKVSFLYEGIGNDEDSAKWKLKDNTIIISDENDTMKLTIMDDNTLAFYSEGTLIKFTRK